MNHEVLGIANKPEDKPSAKKRTLPDECECVSTRTFHAYEMTYSLLPLAFPPLFVLHICIDTAFSFAEVLKARNAASMELDGAKPATSRPAVASVKLVPLPLGLCAHIFE